MNGLLLHELMNVAAQQIIATPFGNAIGFHLIMLFVGIRAVGAVGIRGVGAVRIRAVGTVIGTAVSHGWLLWGGVLTNLATSIRRSVVLYVLVQYLYCTSTVQVYCKAYCTRTVYEFGAAGVRFFP